MKNDTAEHRLQNAVIKYALSNRWLVIRTNSGAVKTDNRFTRFYTVCNNGKSSGLSDLILVKNSFVLFLEIKRPGGKQTAGQKEFQELCRLYGAEYHVIDNLDIAIEIIELIR